MISNRFTSSEFENPFSNCRGMERNETLSETFTRETGDH